MKETTVDFISTYWPIIETYAVKAILALLFLTIAFRIVKGISKRVEKIILARISNIGIAKFLNSVINGLMKLLIILTTLNILGVEMTTFAAVLASVGLAIGLALSGTLQNFAGGVVILLLKPFKVGDFVEAAGYLGVVDEISIFSTYLKTGDNKRVVLPNSSISNSSLINYSTHPTRRVDFTIGIDYGDDIKAAKNVLIEIAKNDSRTLSDQPIQCMLGELGDSSVNILLRAWVDSGDYWPYYWENLEKIKYAFDEKGISFPYPQQDVHIIKNDGQ
jgi:small conductance mechanosensitive channel